MQSKTRRITKPRHRFAQPVGNAARRRRQGSVTLELLFNLPIWLLALAAVVDFGEILSAAQHVSLASRVGAQVAARTAPLPPDGAVPDAVIDAVQRQLAAAGITVSKILVEHNAAGSPARLVWGCPAGDPPDVPLPSQGAYVRVTVFARPNAIVPSLLDKFGLDFSSRVFAQSTTFPYQSQATEIP